MRLVKTGDLTLIKGVLRELLREADEDGSALLDAAVTEFADREHKARKGSEVVALFCGELEEADALGLVGAGSGHAEKPADGSGLEAEHVVFNADGEVGIVEGGIEGESLLGIFAGEFAVFEGSVFVAIDERG